MNRLRGVLLATLGRLKNIGHEARGVATPKEALALLKETDFDIILASPPFQRDSSGANFIREVRKKYPGAKIILMAPDTLSEKDAEEIFTAGAAEILEKPTEEDIENAISDVTSRKAPTTP